jgi:hypothetical protein
MTRHIALYGFIAGLIVATPMVWLMVISPANSHQSPEEGLLYGYLTMLVALTAVFLGVKHYRDKVLGGAIKFMPAFLLGLGISAVASIMYALAWELSLALTHFDFAASYGKSLIEAARAKGASAAELQKVTAEAEAFKKSYANPFYRFPVTFLEMFPVGVLISLISAAVLRNSRLLPARAAS